MSVDALDAAGGATPAALFRGAMRWVVGFAVAGGILGVTVGLLRTDSTTATSTILVTPIAGNAFSPGGRGDDPLNLLTEAELVSSDDVAGVVAEDEGDDVTIAQVLRGLSVTVPTNTQLVAITYEAPSREVAIDRAQAFAERFLNYRKNRAESAINTQVGRLQNQVELAEDQLRDLVEQLNTGTTSQQALTRERIDAVTAYIVVLQTQLSESRAASTYPGQVVTPSSADFKRSLSAAPIYGAIGAVLGFALGLLVAIYRARNSRVVRHVDDVIAIGPRLLVDLPHGAIQQTLASLEEHHSSDLLLAEEFRELRVAVLHEAKGAPNRLMVAAVGERHHNVAPRSALGLALAFARTGLNIIVIDAVVHGTLGPTTILGLQKCRGLTDVLLQSRQWEELLVPIEDGLRVLPFGVVGGGGLDDVLVSQRMSLLLDELGSSADVVMLVTGDVHHPRSRELATLSGPVVVEATEGEATLGEVAALVDLDGGGGPGLLGLIYARHKSRRRSG